MKMQILILFGFFVKTEGCENIKDSNPKIENKALFGKWVNLSESRDTLYFTDTIFYRTNMEINSQSHFYSYELNEDSLKINYLCVVKVRFIKPFVNAINLNILMDILKIQNFQNTYPGYIGEIFRKIKI